MKTSKHNTTQQNKTKHETDYKQKHRKTKNHKSQNKQTNKQQQQQQQGIQIPPRYRHAASDKRALPYSPLWPNVTSSIKPEIHNVSQRRQRRTKPRPQGTCTKRFVQIGPAVPEICLQTDRQTDGNTLLPYWGGVTTTTVTYPDCLALTVIDSLSCSHAHKSDAGA